MPKIRFEFHSDLALVEKTMFFYKIFKNYQPSSRSKYSSKRNSAFNTRNVAKIFLFKIKHNFFKKSFLTQLLLNGTIWILIYKMKIVFTFFKKIFLTVIILKESSLLQDCELASVTCVNISLNKAFKTP